MITKEELAEKFNNAAQAFIRSAKIGNLIKSYEKGIHEYLGVERFWIPNEAAMKKLQNSQLTEANLAAWDTLGHTEKNIKYFSDPRNFSIFGVEGVPIDKKSWYYPHYLARYGFTEQDYFLAEPLEGTRIIAYRRLYSSKLKPSKGPIKRCCGSYCTLVGDGSKAWFESWLAYRATTLKEIENL
jgi:hypothetical protein